MLILPLMLAASLGAVTEVHERLHALLEGEAGASSAAVQRALGATLGWSASAPSGVIAGGRGVAVADRDPAEVWAEIGAEIPILHYFEVSGHGPEAIRIHAPAPDDGRLIEVYRRVQPGIYLRIAEPAPARDGFARAEVSWPGEFVVRAADAHSFPEDKSLFPRTPDPSTDPALRFHWQLAPVRPDVISGPYPLILVHGAATDRWGEFIHWATHSEGAADFRAHFQLWNFLHNMYGINAAIGLDPGCPTFDESIVAYLARFMASARESGVRWNDERVFLPEGPFAMMGHSHGVLKIRALLAHFPEEGAACFAAVMLGGPHMGAPWSTVEWLRHTVARFGITRPNPAELLLEDAVAANYFSIGSQSDHDMGWANLDEGIPFVRFRTWTRAEGRTRRVLSPRDAAITGARELPGFEEDTTFEPQELLENYCGGLDFITPAFRGDLHSDKFFLYGSYLVAGQGLLGVLRRAGDGLMERETYLFESLGLRFANLMAAFTKSANGDFPMSPYLLSDGYVPLQSQLMLDGQETAPVFETVEKLGWAHPRLPVRHRLEVLREHTLGDPERLRIFPGWSHLETVTGRYNRATGESAYFEEIAADLLSALPE